LALVLRQQPGLLLGSCDDTHDSLFELVLLDDLLAAARREERSLVDEVREIGAREAGGSGRERAQIDLRCERLALRVHLEDLLAADAIGPIDDDLTVEAARAQE